jgi:hypothetical protein
MPALMREFWGIAFEDLKTPEEAHIAAPLLCRRCGRQELATIGETEYAVFLQNFVLPRVCAVCRQVTEWEPLPAAVSRAAADNKPETAVATGGGEPDQPQRRGARRVAVRVPIQIKTMDGRLEETVSQDVSRTGLSFVTHLSLSAGDAIEVVVGYGIVSSPASQTAWVVWRRPVESGAKALVGVRFARAGEVEAFSVDGQAMTVNG